MTFLYFAYGSNMLPARLRARCPSARLIGRANAMGFDLEFSKRSQDGSGKASLTQVDNATTHGVLFEIDATELGALDRAEGAGYGRVDDFEVDLVGTGERVSATAYIASVVDPQLKPYDWYLALVIAGAHHHEFAPEYIKKLRLVEYLEDSDHQRKSRRGALDALLGHGFDSYQSLLTSAG
jgi:hypothetical protein